VRLSRHFALDWVHYLAPLKHDRDLMLLELEADPQWLPFKSDRMRVTERVREDVRNFYAPLLRGEAPSLDDAIHLVAYFRMICGIDVGVPLIWETARMSVTASAKRHPVSWSVVPRDVTLVRLHHTDDRVSVQIALSHRTGRAAITTSTARHGLQGHPAANRLRAALAAIEADQDPSVVELLNNL
jgi:hypothetical protein